MGGPHYTPQQRQSVAEMVDRGYSSSIISDRLGIPFKTVRNWREQQPKRRPLDREDVRRRVEAGETDTSIAATLGFSSTTIRKARQRLGIKRRGCDYVSPESRAKIGRLAREAAAERKEVAKLPSPERRWRELIAGRLFEGDDPGDPGMIPPRRDISAGLGASSMAGWA